MYLLKKVLCIILVSFITLNIVGCEITGIPDTPDDSEANEGGTQDNENNQNNENNNSNIDISQYSKLLQNVLTNEYYDELIEKVRNGDNNILKTGEFEPHPYAFLEKQGYDIEAIKAGNDLAYTMSYILEDEPNNLYMYTRVLVDNSYWDNYLLKYKLTDEEMKDYHLVYAGNSLEYNYYIQSIFINNEISKMKTPEIIGTSKMTNDALTGMIENWGKQKLVETDNCHVILLNPNPKDYSCNVVVIPKFFNDNKMTFNSQIIDIFALVSMNMTNNIYTGPSYYTPFRQKQKII